MKVSAVLLVAGLSLATTGCSIPQSPSKSTLTPLTISIDRQEDVAAIPSTSGVEWHQDRLYAVSDDSPWLFELDQAWQLKKKTTLKEYPFNEKGRVPKKMKPDYEALTADGENLIVLGSGSKSPKRDFAYLINTQTGEIQEKIMTDFYKSLKAKAGILSKKKINIEAIAATDNQMLVFHRGNNSKNVIFQLDKAEFYRFMKGESSDLPTATALRFNLPSIGGFVSGFSGASFITEQQALLITSSVEATGDAYNDGEVLGSFIGYLPLSELKDGKDLTQVLQPLQRDGKTVITKVESISVREISTDGSLKVTAASDNDTGVSEFFELTLRR